VELVLVLAPDTEDEELEGVKERKLSGLLNGLRLRVSDGWEELVTVWLLRAELDATEEDEEETSSLIMSTRWRARERRAKRVILMWSCIS